MLVLPMGTCLGVFLPDHPRRDEAAGGHLVPWAWGVNGVFSVLAPLLAVAVATTFGISALLLRRARLPRGGLQSLPEALSERPSSLNPMRGAFL